MLKKCRKTINCFTDENTPTCLRSKLPVCTITTRHMVETHVRVVAGMHGDVLNDTWRCIVHGRHGIFTMRDHTSHTSPRHKTQLHTDDRQRQRETEKEDRDRGRRGVEREDDNTRAERREKIEEREDSFSVWWCMAVLC